MARKLSDSERAMFEAFMAEHSSCWACGWEPGRVRPISRDNWAAPFKLENHHIVGGSGRKHLRDNLARLCSLCHRLHHGDRIRVDGSLLPQLTLANVLWLKARRDWTNFDVGVLDGLAIGVMPEEEKPDPWFVDGYKTRQGGKRPK